MRGGYEDLTYNVRIDYNTTKENESKRDRVRGTIPARRSGRDSKGEEAIPAWRGSKATLNTLNAARLGEEGKEKTVTTGEQESWEAIFYILYPHKQARKHF